MLMIYALINKSYFLDLTPGSSLVEYNPWLQEE
ncbi:MAG: hypothetical protein PHQ94_09795 [Syntrophomonas sp.]|nr:hypothetical protein [Syntrophomonadaceae bacterium]MDD4172517.1 hypothetical protein [Syntrophomonas sp.]